MARFRYSFRKAVRREQRGFVARSFAHGPDSLEALVRSLPIEVVFKPLKGYSGKCVYNHVDRRIYLPRDFWKDQDILARWMRLENEATFLHECFHAIDLNHLPQDQRDALLLPFTGYATNAHKTYTSGAFPLHVEDGVQLAQWFGDDWGRSAAELFADVGVAAYTSLPHHTRSPEALQITPQAIEAVRTALALGA